MKIYIVIIAYFCFMVVVFCGCSFSNNSSVNNNDSNKKVELKLWYYWDISDNQQKLSNLIKEFNESQDSIEVKPVYVPDEDFKKQLSLSIITKKSPDLVLIDSVDHRYYSNMNIFVDLKNEINYFNLYDKESLNSCKMNDGIYGIPFGVNCLALFYNEDMLKQAGCNVPVNWEEFRETAKKLTTNNTYGFAITALESEESLYEFLPILWSYGGDVDDINSEGAKKSFSLLRDLVKDGSMSKSSTNLTMLDLANEFMEKKIAMMFNSSMVVGDIRKNSKDLSWNVTYIPMGKQRISVTGGENWAVLKGSHEEEAVKFLKYVTDKEKLERYISDFGFLSAQNEIMDKQYRNDSVMRKFYDIYKESRQREISEDWPNISEVISSTMNKSIMDEESLDKVISDGKKEIDSILSKDNSNE